MDDGGNNTGRSGQDGATFALDKGIDALSSEAIGPGAATAPLLNAAFPSTGALPALLVGDPADLPGDVLAQSFVLTVGDFNEDEDALKAKLTQIIDDTGENVGVIPLPAAGWFLLCGLGAPFDASSQGRLNGPIVTRKGPHRAGRAGGHGRVSR